MSEKTITKKEAIKVLKAVPKVLQAFAGSLRGSVDPKVKRACDLAIKALRR